MKQFLLYLLVVATIVACSKSDDVGGGNNNNNETPKQPEVTLSTTTADFSTDGGSNVITFTSSEAWTAQVVNTRADDWCSIEPTSGSAGNAKITVTTTTNDTPDDRTASIIIKAGTASKTINVSQKQKDALTVTSSKFEVSAEGGEVLIEVKANIDFEYAIEGSAADWVEYKATRALKTSNLVFEVKENDDIDKREAKITITSGEFSEVVTIYQEGLDPSIILTENEFAVSSSETTVAVEVMSNVDVTVEIPNDVDWITENNTRAFSTNTYYFNVSQNNNSDIRTAEIRFTNKETGISEKVRITQMEKWAVIVAKSEYEFGIDGGKLDLEVQTNAELAIEIYDTWIHQVETRVLETKTLHFNVDPCPFGEIREGYIHIAAVDDVQTITIKQSGMAEILEKEREALIAFYNATGGDNWLHNENWCSDKPASEWYGVYTYENGMVKTLILSQNNLVGEIPDDIDKLENLDGLYLDSNRLSGAIPESICNLKKLGDLTLNDNCLSGHLPDNIGNMESLQNIEIGNYGFVDLNAPNRVNRNRISGVIPKSIGNLKRLRCFGAICNDLTGEIPDELWSLPELVSVTLTGNYLSGELSPAIGNAKKLIQLWLSNNCLTGEIPSEIYKLENLEELFLGNVSVAGVKEFNSSQINRLTGQLSSNISKLSKLRQFAVQCLQLTGNIPDALWDIQTLEWAELDGNFFEGELSPAIGNAKNLTILSIGNNHLSGAIPKEIGELSKLDQFIIGNADYTLGIEIEFDPNTQFNVISGDIPKEISNLTNLSYFSVMGNNITGEFPEFFAYNPRMQGSVPILSGNRMSGTISKEVLMSENWKSWVSPEFYILNQQDGYGFTLDYGELYESTDYSKDGEVKQLQKATKGDGIDIVLMGDAYSDRLIADGTYDQTMQTAMEKFFEEEPYKSFRDHFNVYSVTAVSKNEVYNLVSSTALAGYFGGGTLVGGNDQRAFYYAQRAIGEERMDEALIVVMMNSTAYAGTCYMYNPTVGDHGDGISVSYFPVGEDAESLGRLIHHEAAGHGFSKLGDEYAYENMGAIPEYEIASARAMAEYGWWKNIDFTSDPTKVKWNHFLTDYRYTNDGLGVYEGAFTYWTGAYRPTQNSIMNTNVGGFNAPSRESIYYRIHKLAYGEDWEYDYEEFVEWDAKNRTSTRGIPYRLDIPDNFQPTHPPVVVKSSWRSAKNNAPKKAATNNGGNAGSNLRPATSNRTNQQTMSISPNRTVSSSGMVVTIDPATGRKAIERMEIK